MKFSFSERIANANSTRPAREGLPACPVFRVGPRGKSSTAEKTNNLMQKGQLPSLNILKFFGKLRRQQLSPGTVA